MKTITLSDEMCEKLKELANKYYLQKTHTRTPYLYTIKSKERITCDEFDTDVSGYEWVDTCSGDYLIYDDDGAKEWCNDHNYYFDGDRDFLGDMHTEVLEKRYYKYIDTFDCRGNVNVFFTRESANKYIEEYRHNLPNENYHSYEIYCDKNYEIELITDFLKELINEDNT
jgi:hypothetical protein